MKIIHGIYQIIAHSNSPQQQSVVIFGIELHGTSPNTVPQSPKFLVANICNLLDVTDCQFRELAAALLGPVHFLSPDQQSGIHCLNICSIQLLTPNNLGRTWRRNWSPDIRSVSTLEVFTLSRATNRHLLTYLLSLGEMTYPCWCCVTTTHRRLCGPAPPALRCLDRTCERGFRPRHRMENRRRAAVWNTGRKYRLLSSSMSPWFSAVTRCSTSKWINKVKTNFSLDNDDDDDNNNNKELIQEIGRRITAVTEDTRGHCFSAYL